MKNMKKSSKDELTTVYLLNLLRKGTITWSGRTECLRRARKRVQIGVTKKGRPKYKFHWQCAKCRSWYDDEGMLEVDHIVEVGPFNGDWNIYIPKLYCGQENLQALCMVCHAKKTSKFNASLRFVRREASAIEIL